MTLIYSRLVKITISAANVIDHLMCCEDVYERLIEKDREGLNRNLFGGRS
jgi:hypothetical protein